jgi:O-antigen ligase
MKQAVFMSLWLLVFFIPMENIITFEGFGTVARLVGIFCIILAFFHIVMTGKIRAPGGVLILFSCFIMWAISSYFWTLEPEFSTEVIFSLLQLFAFVWLIWQYAEEEKEQVLLLSAYVAGCFGAIIGLFYAYLNDIQSGYFRYSTFGFDPNDLGVMLALGVPISWWLAVHVKKKYLSVLYYLYFPLSSFGIVLTASRTAFLALLVSSVFVIISLKKLRVTGKLLCFALICLTLFGSIYYLPDYSWERLGTITSSFATGDFNVRELIWQDALKTFSSNPILGVGAGSSNVGLFQFGDFNWTKSTHNLFLMILLDLGLIGMLAFFSILYFVLKNVMSMPTLHSRLWIITMSTWFIGVMALGWAYKKPTWFLIAMLAVQGALFAKPNDNDFKKANV